MAKRRISIPLEEWPHQDRQAFERALQPGELFTSQGLAAHWAPATRIWAIKGYGHWLRHLQRTGSLDEQLAPSARASAVVLRGYVGDLKQRLAPASVAGRMRALLEVLRVIDPRGDHELVRRVCKITRVRAGERSGQAREAGSSVRTLPCRNCNGREGKEPRPDYHSKRSEESACFA